MRSEYLVLRTKLRFTVWFEFEPTYLYHVEEDYGTTVKMRQFGEYAATIPPILVQEIGPTTKCCENMVAGMTLGPGVSVLQVFSLSDQSIAN